MDIYREWGFKENPFKISALPAEKEGDKLIAGRESEISQFLRRLHNQPQIPTLEGLNGIGKTSLINVAIYRSFKDYLKNKETVPLFIPSIRSIQLDSDSDLEEFIDKVYVEIAQTVIKYEKDIKTLGITIPSNIKEIRNWLNSPFTNSYQGNLGFAGASLGGGKNKDANTSTGFERSGFQRVIRSWLQQIFPTKDFGGIVCIIDNLELLEHSSSARKLVERLRDELFDVHGIRWVMCGSLGIVTSLVHSPRLEGVMHDPIEVNSILKLYLKEVFNNRLSLYKGKSQGYLPITLDSFGMLFDILKGNIRNTLKFTNDFCQWVADRELMPEKDKAKETIFVEWLMAKSNKYWKDIKSRLSSKTLGLFKNAVLIDGVFALSDFRLFNYSTPQKMRTCVRELERLNLVICVIDEKDNRRKSIQITPKGWFVSNVMET